MQRDGIRVPRTSNEQKKQWRTPALRKLPITATAMANKGDFNEGQGKGKGNSGSFFVS
jgi:hypothetical protein